MEFLAHQGCKIQKKTVILWNIIVIYNIGFPFEYPYFKIWFIPVKQSWIFSIITPV